jgi:hypothetical protein
MDWKIAISDNLAEGLWGGRGWSHFHNTAKKVLSSLLFLKLLTCREFMSLARVCTKNVVPNM